MAPVIFFIKQFRFFFQVASVIVFTFLPQFTVAQKVIVSTSLGSHYPSTGYHVSNKTIEFEYTRSEDFKSEMLGLTSRITSADAEGFSLDGTLYTPGPDISSDWHEFLRDISPATFHISGEVVINGQDRYSFSMEAYPAWTSTHGIRLGKEIVIKSVEYENVRINSQTINGVEAFRKYLNSRNSNSSSSRTPSKGDNKATSSSSYSNSSYSENSNSRPNSTTSDFQKQQEIINTNQKNLDRASEKAVELAMDGNYYEAGMTMSNEYARQGNVEGAIASGIVGLGAEIVREFTKSTPKKEANKELHLLSKLVRQKKYDAAKLQVQRIKNKFIHNLSDQKIDELNSNINTINLLSFLENVESEPIQTNTSITATEIIENYLYRIGGKEKLQEIQSFSYAQEVLARGQLFTTKIKVAKSGLFNVMVLVDGKEYQKIVFDGSNAYQIYRGKKHPLDDEIYKKTSKTIKAAVLPELEAPNAILNGIVEVEGQGYYIIELNQNHKAFYSKNTGLKVMDIFSINEGSIKVELITMHYNYQLVDGFLFPYNQVTKDQNGTISGTVYSEIEFNVDFTDAD